MRNLLQLLMWDDGTPDVTVKMSVAREPLRLVRRKPNLELCWQSENTDFRVFYWHEKEPMTEDGIKALAHQIEKYGAFL